MTAEAIDHDLAVGLLALGTAIACAETAVTEFSAAPFDQDDIDLLLQLPLVLRTKIASRLVELVDQLREDLRNLDGALLAVMAGQRDTTTA